MKTMANKKVAAAATAPTQDTNPIVRNLFTTKPTNADLTTRLTDSPLNKYEAAQVLAFYLPLVAANSTSDAWQDHYLLARLELSLAIGHELPSHLFMEAVEVGAEIYARRLPEPGVGAYDDWNDEQLSIEISTIVDQLLGGVQ